MPSLWSGAYNVLRNVRAESCGAANSSDVHIDSDGNELFGIASHQNAYPGTHLDGADNTLVGTVTSNNGDPGVRLWSSNDISETTIVDVLTVGTATHGIFLQMGEGVTMAHVSAVNNCDTGVSMAPATDKAILAPTVNQALLANNANFGLLFVGAVGSGQGLFSYIAALHSGPDSVQMEVEDNMFTGTLFVSEASQNCVVSEDAAGLIQHTCSDTGADGSSSYPGQPSDGSLRINVGVADSFQGPMTSDDSVNQSDVDGAQFYAFTPGQACPASIHGGAVITDSQTRSNAFIQNARELVLDDIGDDDGLCESAEACVYSPNIGAYQGEGDLASSCVLEDGDVSGVIMFSADIDGR